MDNIDQILNGGGANESQTPSVDAILGTTSEQTAPQNVTNARQYLKIPSQNYDGWCETFAENVSGLPNMGGSAAQAWNNFAKQGKAFSNINQAPAGSLVYFAADPENQEDGHVAILSDPNTKSIIAATDNGVQEMPISQWQKQTGQELLGFVPIGGK